MPLKTAKKSKKTTANRAGSEPRRISKTRRTDCPEHLSAPHYSPDSPAGYSPDNLWENYKASQSTGNSDYGLRNKLIEIHLPLVDYIAKKVYAKLPASVELDDLISEGVFGLMDAVDAYDLSKKVKFATYATPRIRGAILDNLRKTDWVPRLVRTKTKGLAKAKKTLEKILGRQPDNEEIAKHLGISSKKLQEMIDETSRIPNIVSLQKRLNKTDSYDSDCEDLAGENILKNTKAEEPDKRMQESEFLKLVTQGMNKPERILFISYYYEGMTMKEIGESLGLSESRVSQMYSLIMYRLQERAETDNRLAVFNPNPHQEVIKSREGLRKDSGRYYVKRKKTAA